LTSSLLIIDDDVTLLSRLGDQLEEAGFQVARSNDLRHSEGLYAERRPDLVILDVRTGDGEGWELLGRLAAETPVLVLSAAAREEDVVRGFEAGAVDYVSKPYRSAELVARLRARLAASEPVLAAPARQEAQPAEPVGPPPPSRPRRTTRRPAQEEESVFMSEAEEMALLRMPLPAAEAPPRPTESAAEGQSFGKRLRSERQRRHLTLVQIENDLRTRMSYLQAMEDEKFTLLPRGPAAIQMVRSYAQYLGLDAEAILSEFRAQHYVEAAEPPPALGGSRLARGAPRWAILLAAVLLALAVGVGAIYALDPAFFAQLPAFFQGLWQQIVRLLPGG
jgi:DNA-binding response OmpR family regulator/transcriptional regulator with XRE-family HTH domain